MWKICVLLFLVEIYADIPPPSPCPDIYQFESDGGTLKGLITIKTPPKYPKVQLSLKAILSFTELIDKYDLPDVSIEGKQLAIYDEAEQVPDGKEGFIEYYVNFVSDKPVPTLLSLMVNDEERCVPQPDPADWRMRVIVDYSIEGINGPVRERRSSRSEIRKFDQGRPPVTNNKPSMRPGSYNDFEVDFSNCGVPGELPTPLVVHGAAAHRVDWPWQAAIFKKDKDRFKFSFHCGGTLVTRRHIITAGHCVVDTAPSSLSILLGKENIGTLHEMGQQGAEVKQILVHPEYDSSYHNDISLLLLNEPVRISSYVKPACLWDGLSTGLGDVVGKVASVPGWGKDETGYLSETLKVAGMLIVSQEECLRSDVDGFYLRFTSKKSLCAGFKNGTGPCSGDSGGGLFLNLQNSQQGRNTWFLRGLVSVSKLRNLEECDVNSYTVFTDVAMFGDWLKGHIRQSQ